MKIKVLALLCALALMLGALYATAFAADTDVVAVNGAQSYSSLQSAVENYESGVIVLQKDASDITVDGDVYMDLSGHSIENVTVTAGTLYCMDSETDDYSVADGVYGKLTGTVSGSVASVPVEANYAEDGYLMVTDADGVSFHRVKLQIYAMSLRADRVGVYYKSHFVGDEIVADQVATFGVALSVAGEPTAQTMETQCGFSVFRGFKAGDGSNSAANTGTLLHGIMKEENGDEVNARNSTMAVYGRPYIKTSDGYIFGKVVSRSLQQQMEAVDAVWETLSDSQKTVVLDMYGVYQAAMEEWKIPNISGKEPEPVPAEKFDTVFPEVDAYLYRVGNMNAVSMSSLFAAKTDVEIGGNVTVHVESLLDNERTGFYSLAANSNWAASKLDFADDFTGPVRVTITDDDEYCIPTTLYMEVVDAMNATSASSATAYDVVLLNNCGFGSITVSGGHTLYGNGFTMTCTSDSVATDRNYSFVTLENGTLDNVQIKTPNFSYAVLYDSNKKESGNISETDSSGKTRYYNIRSAVLASGDSKILNSYVSGGRAAIYLIGGELLVDNSTIEGGAAANIHIESAIGLTLRDVTLIQEPKTASVHDTSKTLMGLSVVAMCDDKGFSTPITLEGTLTQYAWACKDYKQYVPSGGQSLVDVVLKKSSYLHSITYAGGVAKDSINLGFLYMPSAEKAPVEPVANGMMIDKRTDAAEKPYGAADINGSAYVYSYSNAKGTAAEFANKPVYCATEQAPARPVVSFKDLSDARTFETAFDSTKGWVSALNVDVDAGNYTFSFDDLIVEKFGKALAYTVQTVDGIAVDKAAKIVLNDSSTAEYILTVTDDQIYDQAGQLTGEVAVHTCTFMLLASKTSIPAPVWASTNLNGPHYMVVTTKNSDWSCAVNVLDDLNVTYWSKSAGAEKTLNLGDITFASVGEQNGSNNSIVINGSDYTLTVTTSGFKSNDNGKPVVVTVNNDNKLYFTVSSSSNYVSTSTTSRTVTITYKFQDANNTDALTLTKSVAFNYSDYKATQYVYSDFCKGTLKEAGSGSGSCVTPETLITLADGTQVAVKDLTGAEQLLAWDLETGTYTSAPIVFIDRDARSEYEIVHLYFSDGTDVEVIAEHGFFDADLGKYVYLDAHNAAAYIGHSFVKQGDIADVTWETVELVDVVIEKRETTAYSPVTFSHLCYYVDGMLSMPGGIDGLFNIFDVDTDTMAYDSEKKAQDIESYGLFVYEDFAGMIPEEAFYAFNGAYLKVAIEKGMLTWEDIEYLAQRYVPLM